jgi:hypothetical protein
MEDLVEMPQAAALPAVAAPTPSHLLQMAVQQGADLEKLERLMALQERWEANEARKAYTLAMNDFKATPIDIYKRKLVGYKTKQGGVVGYSHAELSDVTEAIGPVMAKHQLSYRWNVTQGQGLITVECIVTHAMGHSERISMSAPPDTSGQKNAIQQTASAVTYLQRYTLLAITGMSTKGMDDDGDGSDGPIEAEPSKLLQAGQEAAMEGMKSLTAWWGGLTAKQRSELNKDFPSLRNAANLADQGVGA